MAEFGTFLYGADTYGTLESLSADMLGDDVVVVSLEKDAVVNEAFSDVSNYSVEVVSGNGNPVEVKRVYPPVEGDTTRTIVLEVTKPSKGTTYKVSAAGLKTKIGTDVSAEGLFVGRRTKLESMMRNLASHWNRKPDSVIRNILAAISIEDDRIGGYKGEITS